MPLSSPGSSLCPLCEDYPPVFDHTLVAMPYEAPWNRLITRMKFQEDTALSRPLSALMLQAILARWQLPATARGRSQRRLRAGAPTLLIPVPLSPQRMHERGFNQASLLAHKLGKALQIPVHDQLLTRQQHTPRLMSLQAQDRQAHIKGAFRLDGRQTAVLRGRHVAIVDDVLTTGATANEVSRVLWQAGAREISVWVVARTGLSSPAEQAA